MNRAKALITRVGNFQNPTPKDFFVSSRKIQHITLFQFVFNAQYLSFPVGSE